MKKIKNPLLLLALGATAICGISLAINNSSEKPIDVSAQTVDEYYSSVSTSSRQQLMDDLEDRLNDGAVDLTYDGLWSAYPTTDVKPGTNILWDMYSNESYTTNDPRINKNYKKEGDSVNREHSIPKSWFNEKFPMKSDLFHVYPTDGYVNNRRSNYPHGEVGTPTYTSKNGSKLGPSKTSGISGTVFEPIDEYKGDFARTYFYMATRYASKVGGWSGAVFSGSFPHINSNYIELYYKWHINDPVSTKETDRNDAAFLLQKNRNPYIDHPEWVDYVFKGIQPTPETKTLEKIEVSGTATTKSYYVGDAFDMSGLTVTATFDDNGTKTTSNVTSSVKVEPATLSLDTKSVTLSYTYNKITKSTTFSDFTVSEKPATNYGTLDNPLSVSQAKSLIQEQCTASGVYTKQPIYCRAKVGTISSKDSTNKRMNLYANDISTSSVVMVEALGMTSEQYNVIATGDEIIFHGYGFKNSYGTYEFFNNSTYYPSLDRNITKEAEIPVSSVTITNSKKDYYIGETCQISTTVLPSNATNKTLTYSSNNTGVASVNSSGLVTFKAAGSATITVSSNNGKTATITFIVTKAPVHVTQINVSLPSNSYYVGDTADLIYEVLPKDADNKNVTFESTNTSVATVNTEGEVNFIKAGSVTLKVISSDVSSVYGQVTVTVSERPAEDILVTDIVVDDSLSLLVNEESQISYQVIPTNATDKTVSWSSNNSKVATVDEDGVVKGLSEGTAVITVTANDAGHVSKTINVEVTKPVEVIKVSQINVPSSITLKVNENANIEYKVLPENATDKSVTISSANDEIATINGTKVVGVSEGTTEINISSNDGGATASIPVTVAKGEEPVTKTIAEIAVVNLPNKTTYEIGEDFDKTGLVVNVNYTDGTEENISSQVSLSEVDTSVSGAKTVEITYKTNYKTSFQVIVLEASVLSISMEKTPAKMNYFADEPLNTYGLVIKATMSDDSVIANVANMCTYTYDFATSNKVQISFSGKQLSLFVTLENVVQEKPVQHKAADFAYVFIEKLEPKEPASVSQSEWDALQYYYNKLDTASKEFLKNYKVSSNGNGEVSAEVPEVDALKEFATKYDAIYSARKADGFTDFIGRASVQPIPGPTPTPTPTPSSDNKTLIIVIVVICVVAVAIIAIIIPVEVKRSKRSKKNAQ